MKQLSTDETIARGILAAHILEDNNIISFFDEQLELIKESLVNTQPDEEKVRNSLYYQHKGVTEFLQILVAYKEAATQLITALEAENNNEKGD